MNKEKYPNDLDRLLTPEEKIIFAEEVVWPAVDYLYGADFRAKAQTQKRSRLKPKIIELIEGPRAERIIIEAASPKGQTIINRLGDREKECWAEITIEEICPELHDGAASVMDQDEPDEKDGAWWNNEEFDWQTWQSRSYDFTNNPQDSFKTYLDLDVQDESEDSERFLWSFTDADVNSGASESGDDLGRREDELEEMLSYRDCLEIRAALIRFGIPVEIMANMEMA
jgi:hypothetical protein